MVLENLFPSNDIKWNGTHYNYNSRGARLRQFVVTSLAFIVQSLQPLVYRQISNITFRSVAWYIHFFQTISIGPLSIIVRPVYFYESAFSPVLGKKQSDKVFVEVVCTQTALWPTSFEIERFLPNVLSRLDQYFHRKYWTSRYF